MANAEAPAIEIPEESQRHAGGRPLTYATIDELDKAIAEYFDDCNPHIEGRMQKVGTTD